MTQCTADFEAGTNGANIQATDPGSATAWDVDTNSTNLTYDTTHAYAGTKAAKLILPGSGQAYVYWSTAFGTPSEHYGRCYAYLSAYPAGYPRGLFVTTGAAFNDGFSIAVGPEGIPFVWYAGTSKFGTVAITTGQFVRLEWHVVHSATVGSFEVRLYNTPTAAIGSYDDNSCAMSNVNTGAAPVQNMLGTYSGGSATGTVWIDEYVGGASNWVGGPAVRAAGWADVTITA